MRRWIDATQGKFETQSGLKAWEKRLLIISQLPGPKAQHLSASQVGSGERLANQTRKRVATECEHDQLHMFPCAIGDWLMYLIQ